MGWDEEEVTWTETILEKFVLLMKLVTSWYISPIWVFVITFLGGQHIIYCVLLSIVVSVFAYYVWREIPTKSYSETEE